MTVESAMALALHAVRAAEACLQLMQTGFVTSALQLHALAERGQALQLSGSSGEAVLHAEELSAASSDARVTEQRSPEHLLPCVLLVPHVRRLLRRRQPTEGLISAGTFSPPAKAPLPVQQGPVPGQLRLPAWVAQDPAAYHACQCAGAAKAES